MQLEASVETRLTERIDEFLKEISGTSLVDSGKAIDFCLDHPANCEQLQAGGLR
jgi:hypothetical protein